MRTLILLALLATPAAAQPDPPRTEVGAVYLMSVGGSTDRVRATSARGGTPGIGGGGAVAVWHRLGDGLGLRVRAGLFEVAIPQESAIQFGPDTFRMADLAVALRLQHRLSDTVRASFGPQVAVGWWQLEAGDERAAYLAGIGNEVVDDTGVLWRADVALGLAAELAAGVSVRAGFDLPLVPHNRWGRRVEVLQRGLADLYLITRYVPVPRAHVGLSARLR